MTTVVLRPVEDDDVEIFHQYESDPEASRRAAFPAREHDRFVAHFAKIRVDPTVTLRTVLADGEVAGNIVEWEQDGQHWLGYWFGRAFWGRGVGTAALRLFLDEVRVRPLYADPAEQNVGSVRLLEKVGFKQVPPEEQPPPDNGITHILLVLDDSP
ncbi:GNAT family N-acetyltransferase [Kribbella sp. NBC_01245]|uniref:GNAT family N-acetyltransferase n=1 Tax=Kribbella sp. NBC_01245 TaxID=2903578 RepID=UPI002E2ACC7B|nr:GNAT family N-acetyltransferase [Kribbella sp. NBC_01245]